MKLASVGLFAGAVVAIIPAIAQERPASDPRIGLRAGFRDAGTAALNL